MSDLSDEEAIELIEKLLDKMERKPFDCEINEWEEGFLLSNMDTVSFSDKQKAVILRIAEKN